MKEYVHPLFSSGQFPKTEAATERPSRRPAHPAKAVVRISLSRPGGKSWHVQRALRAYLAHPASLPRDPGPGVHVITVRLALGEVARGMALAKEPGRAAFIRRILEWRYPLEPAAKPVPVAAPSPVTAPEVGWRPKQIPIPVAPTSGRRALTGPQFERLIRSYGYSLVANESAWRYFLRADGVIEACECATGRVGQTWAKPNFGK